MKRYKILQFNTNRTVSFALLIIVYYALFNGAVFSVFDAFSLPGKQLVDLLLLAIEGGLILYALLISMKNNPKLVGHLYSFVGFACLFTILLFPENKDVLVALFKDLFLFCVPSFIFVFLISDFEFLWKILEKNAFPLIICGLLYSLLANGESSYSMWLGYQMLIPTMIILNGLFCTKFSFVKALQFLIGVVVILLKGSRGPLVVLLAYFFVCIYLYKTKSNSGKEKKMELFNEKRTYIKGFGFIVLWFVLIGAVLGLLNLQVIAGQMYDLLLGVGLDVRTLRVLAMDNALTYVSGRDTITEVALSLIQESPLCGYGLAGDRVHIGKAAGAVEADFGGYYAHNFILEMILHFGIPMGTIILSMYYWVLYNQYKRISVVTRKGRLYIILLLYLLISSMLSGTYLTSPIFWMTLGLAMNGIFCYNKQKV